MSESPTTVLWGVLRRSPQSDYQPIRDTAAAAPSLSFSHYESERGKWKVDTGSTTTTATGSSVEWNNFDVSLSPSSRRLRPAPGSWRDFFFGFMYEDDYEDNDTDSEYLSHAADVYVDDCNYSSSSSALLWVLGLSLALSSASTSCASTLVSAMAHDSYLQQQQPQLNPYPLSSTMTENYSASSDQSIELAAQHFAQNAAAAAIWGTALGKLSHGMIPDLVGARRTSMLFAWGLCLVLLVLALSPTSTVATSASFGVEFVSAVQWPCAIVLLATHYRGGHIHQQQLYQRGVAIASLASRCGALVAIPLSARCLQWGVHWRWMAVGAAWCAALSASFTYLFVTDSIHSRNEPQNPIDPALWSQAVATTRSQAVEFSGQEPQTNAAYTKYNAASRVYAVDRNRQRRLFQVLHWIKLVLHTNVWPSLSHILGSTTFWMVALAHTGSTMVRTSQRLLGTYLFATRSSLVGEESSSLTYERAASLAVWYSIGSVLGLAVAGPIFTQTRDLSARQWMIGRLYLLCIISCYVLAFLAIPSVRLWLDAPPDTITSIQVAAAAASGFSIAVPSYLIPSWVGVTFGCDKGLFSAYTDGVACAVSCLLWRHVRSAMWEGHTEVGGGGVWAYAWAAIALFLILSATLMVEFMGHFFRKTS